MRAPEEMIEALLAEGVSFDFGNFSSKSDRGYPEAYSPDWIAWATRARSLIRRLFGAESAPLDMLKAGDEVDLLGWGPDHFEHAKAYYLGALKAAAQILKDDTFAELRGGTSAPGMFSQRVFVVHGHNHAAKAELEVLLTGLGMEPVVLHRQPDKGQTLIEKFEENSDVGYAFILLTPDDVAYVASQESLPDGERTKERRARQNVIFEFGYFVGRLGRDRVCCLYTGGLALPSDLSGLVYKQFTSRVEEVGLSIVRELQAAGYSIDLNGGV